MSMDQDKAKLLLLAYTSREGKAPLCTVFELRSALLSADELLRPLACTQKGTNRTGILSSASPGLKEYTFHDCPIYSIIIGLKG